MCDTALLQMFILFKTVDHQEFSRLDSEWGRHLPMELPKYQATSIYKQTEKLAFLST